MEPSSSPRRPSLVLPSALATAILVLAAAVEPAHGQSAPAISIAWDANTEREVVGYVVYIGTSSGVYTSVHDVGNRTSFTYAPPLEGRRYYFAVAAYAAGKLIGQRSAEISEFAGGAPFPLSSIARALPPPAPADLSSADPPRSRSSESSVADAPQASVICDAAGSAPCYVRRVRATNLAFISALAAVPDGRVFVIENGARLRVIDGGDGTHSPDVALSIGDRAARLTGIAVDPEFLHTRYVFVGLARTGPDGRRRLSIVRYREVENRFGEPVVVVTELPLFGAGDPPLAADALGRIYVAMPADEGSGRDPYAGHVLWFNANGTVPSGSRAGSPVLAHGYPFPLTLAPAGDRLWLVGAQVSWPSAIAHVPTMIDAGAHWPLVPVLAGIPMPGGTASQLAVREFDTTAGGGAATDESATAVIVDALGRLHRLRVSTGDGSERIDTFTWPDGERVLAADVGGRHEVYVLLQKQDGTFALEELSAGAGPAPDER